MKDSLGKIIVGAVLLIFLINTGTLIYIDAVPELDLSDYAKQRMTFLEGFLVGILGSIVNYYWGDSKKTSDTQEKLTKTTDDIIQTFQILGNNENNKQL